MLAVFVSLILFFNLMTVTQNHPLELFKEPVYKEGDSPTPKLWLDRRCRTNQNVNAFWVKDIGYVDCDFETCPLTDISKYGVNYCYACCWGNVTSELHIHCVICYSIIIVVYCSFLKKF